MTLSLVPWLQCCPFSPDYMFAYILGGITILVDITLLRFICIVASHLPLPCPHFSFSLPHPPTHTNTNFLIFFSSLPHFPATFLLEINLEVCNSLFHYYRLNPQRFVYNMPKICVVKNTYQNTVHTKKI